MAVDPSRAPSAEFWREPRTISDAAQVLEAAERMASESAGCLVVVDADGRAIGMLTDRDLALRVVARPGAIDALRVGDVMSRPLVSIGLADPLRQALERMEKRGVRRIPVLDGDERPVGLIALDDLLHRLGIELHDLSQEGRSRRPPPPELVEREARDLLERLEELVPRLEPRTRARLVERIRAL
jgi:signal-transduction protein with cAMP-binding, CBS, and nucleotidyltransferase domain